MQPTTADREGSDYQPMSESDAATCLTAMSVV